MKWANKGTSCLSLCSIWGKNIPPVQRGDRGGTEGEQRGFREGGSLLHDGVEVDVFSFFVKFFDEKFTPCRVLQIALCTFRNLECAPSAIHFREGVHLAFRSGCGEAVDGDKGCTA